MQYPVELDYDYWTADEILHAFLPEDLKEGSPSGFAMTGHLGIYSIFMLADYPNCDTAHVNLNDEYLPYKHIIGQLILDVSRQLP